MPSENTDDLIIEVDESLEDEAFITYDIASYPSDFTLQGIVDKWKDGDITIPEFQREFVWSIKQSSLLIESFLLGLPVPPVFFYIDEENKNLVIDDQQRIQSIVFYFEGFFGKENPQGKRLIFRLQGLDERSPYFKKTFDELDPSDQRKLKNTVLRAINIKQLSPAEESTSIYHIFERLNTGGTPLKSQEIRNVVFRGKFVSVLRDLNKDKNWRLILGQKTSNRYQTDVELVLRLFALRKGPENYSKPMKEYLNKAMKQNQDGDTTDVTKFKKEFPRVTKFIIDMLGEKPFHLRGPLNTSALDSVFSVLLTNLGSLPNDISKRFEKLKRDPEFDKYTIIGTTDAIL